MQRLSLYLIGIAAALAAVLITRRQNYIARPVPVDLAAEQLRQAWAKNHTSV